MNRRMLFAMVFAGLFGFAAFVHAADEPKKDKGDKGGRRGNMFALVEKLNLSDDQKAKLKTIREEAEPKLKEAREAKDREAMKKVFMEVMAKVEAILTDDQKEQLKKLREEAAKDREKPKTDK